LSCVGSKERSPATAAALQHHIEAAGLAARVNMLGELDGAALEQCFAAADLFVLPTRHEGFGMVVAEALAHGLPVLATRTGAIAGLVLPDAGMVVPPDDREALQDALASLLSDRALLRRFANGALAARARLPGWSQSCAEASRVLIGMSAR